jgi:hypothetical protein
LDPSGGRDDLPSPAASWANFLKRKLSAASSSLVTNSKRVRVTVLDPVDHLPFLRVDGTPFPQVVPPYDGSSAAAFPRYVDCLDAGRFSFLSINAYTRVFEPNNSG